MIDTDSITSAPLETRMRWYAEINSWRIPEDFPVDMADVASLDDRAKFKDPKWQAAWRALTGSMTEAEMSLGWWLHALGKTEDEWATWWRNGRRL